MKDTLERSYSQDVGKMDSKNLHKLEPRSWSRRHTCVALMSQGGAEYTVESVKSAAPTRCKAGRLLGFSALFADNEEVHELHLAYWGCYKDKAPRKAF